MVTTPLLFKVLPIFFFNIFLLLSHYWNTLHFFKLITLFIYLFLAVLGPRPCARALSSCGKRGPLLITVRGPPTTAASPAAEHRLQTRRPSRRGSRAQPLRGTRDPPRPGPEPVSPALAGRLPTTAPPGKPKFCLFLNSIPRLTNTKKHQLGYLACPHLCEPGWVTRFP